MPEPTPTSHTFQVDLRGIVDLLSHHLYGSPRVYVRELLQNAVDAITASGSPSTGIDIEPAEDPTTGALSVHDDGIGLTETQVHELLATIGRSSKRDDLGFAREEFLGQFGIGLLSCFLVADEIRVVTRHGDHPTVVWTGHADGSYETALADEQRDRPGTTVVLTPRRDTAAWLTAETVTELAGLYGSMLPVPVRVAGTDTSETPPWAVLDGEDPAARARRQVAYARRVLGFDPFDAVDISVPAAGLRGVAYVLPVPVSPASQPAHRVYLKRMLLAENIGGLLPDWAFFVRCVVDTGELRPTANREALYEDDLLDEVRGAIGDQLRGWLTRLGATDPARLMDFLRVHHLSVKALAVHDDDMLRLVEQWWPCETTMGPMSLAEVRAKFGTVRYTPSVDEFRQIASVAAAQGIALVNAGYVYEADLITRIPELGGGRTVERVDPAGIVTDLAAVEPAEDLRLRPFLNRAQRTLDRFGVEVLLRSYEPAGVPALYLLDGDIALTMDLRRGSEEVDGLWAGILGDITPVSDRRPQLVFNHRNPLVREVAGVGDDTLETLAVEGLYAQALLLGHHPLRPADTEALNKSFLGLLAAAMGVER